MITVLLGPDHAMLGYCHSLEEREAGAILLPPNGTDNGRRLVRANADLRHLLARLRKSLGSEDFESSISRHRVAAAFLLDRIFEDLSANELERYRELSTDILTHTSHNWYTNSFVVGAWADLFIDLLSQIEVTVIIPSIQLMSSNLISVIRQVIIKGQPQGLHLMVGFGERQEGGDYSEDSHGIIWDTKVFSNLRESFLCMPDAVVYELSGEDLDKAIESSDLAFTVDTLDSDPESRFERKIQVGSLDEDDGKWACLVLERTFGSYDFRTSLQIGLRLLAAEVPLSNSDRAFVLTATSISAHNRQFPSASGSEKLSSFLAENLSSALELETDVFTRSVISYRLATTLARRMKNGTDAMDCINNALGELRSEFPPSRKRAYYEAWLLNIKAYSHMLLKEFGESANSVEGAFGLAEKYWNHEDDLAPGELYSSQLFAGNRATLAMYGGDDAALDRWFARGTEIFEAHSDIGKRYVRFLRINILKKKLDLAGAINAGEEGLADAILENSAEYQDLYRMNLADLYFKIGDLPSTFRCLEECMGMYVKVREVHRMTAANLLWAAAKIRQGEYQTADEIYSRLLTTGEEDDPSALADLLSARGCLAAKLGRMDDAERLMDKAIELAVDLGERDVLVLVARRSGDALMSAGEMDEARKAYLQGLDILKLEVPESTGSLPDEAARIYWGLYRCDPQAQTMTSLLSVLSEAITVDSDLWWEISGIAKAIVAKEDLNMTDSLEEIEALKQALRQRTDTEDVPPEFLVSLAVHGQAMPERNLGA